MTCFEMKCEMKMNEKIEFFATIMIKQNEPITFWFNYKDQVCSISDASRKIYQ